MKKVISVVLITIILLINFTTLVNAVGVTYTREGGEDIRNVANIIDDNLYVDGDYNANSIRVSDIKVYEYESNTEMQCTGDGTQIPFGENTDKYYLYSNGSRIYYAIKLGATDETHENIATFVYKKAIEYNGKKYDVKINFKGVNKIGNNEEEVRFCIGERENSDEDLYNLSTYSNPINPQIGSFEIFRDGVTTGENKTEIKVEYYIVDDEGNSIAISGVLAITDIDFNQGFYIDNFVATNDETNKNVFITNDTNTNVSTIMYKLMNSSTGTYIYSTTNGDIEEIANTYLLMKNKTKVDITFTFDSQNAYSSLVFVDGIVKRYKNIFTEVVGGTITPTITEIRDGENKTVVYSPNSVRQYLKQIIVDGVEQPLTTYTTQYDFTNITQDHTIRVVYGNKYKVTYDAKGGTPNPETEYVLPNEKATQPTQEPTKRGYTFEGWKKTGETTDYNFNTLINEDINLDAEWTPVIYNINYVLNGGVNDSTNPEHYTVEDTIDFKNPTREGYDFLGWYEDATFTTPIAGVSNRTGDITVYAKWQAKENTAYKVEHYKESDNGEYTLVVTDELTGRTDELVTAVPKQYTGYKENQTHANRISSGAVKADGSLVLKLYYDKEKYTVTFDPQNDTKIDDQIVKYLDKATEPTKPTKEGYTFEYWYYINENGEQVKYNFDDPVTADIDLIGKWEEVKPATPDKQEPKNDAKDDTTSKDKLPQTGEEKGIFIAIAFPIIIAIIIFGKKYLNLKDISK